MILSALTDYNLGNTLEQTAARLKKKTNRRVSRSTIIACLDEYKQHCTYLIAGFIVAAAAHCSSRSGVAIRAHQDR